MRREDFLDMMDGKVPAERAVIAELSGLTELFPWFQGAHLLLLKALKDSGDFRFDSQLRNSAVYISDREHLYYYLRGLPAGPEPKPVTPQMTGIAELPRVEQSLAVTTDEVQVEQEPAVNMEAPGEDEMTEAKGHPILIPGDAETDEAPGIMIITDEVDAPAGTADIAILDADYGTADESELLELIDDDETDTVSSSSAMEVQQRSKRDMQTDLIDRFIIANPRIEPRREQPDLPAEDLSRASGTESGTFVTETLAHIYIHQGYYSRAIDIYEKLSLKYPEKSSYFAAQIEKVKEYLKK